MSIARSKALSRAFLWVASAHLLWAASACADEQDFSGVVRKIFDGDSFLVRPAKGRDVDVRLQDIDAPEKDQPYGATARSALVKIIADRSVFVDVVDTDHYGRKVVRVFREPDRLDIIKAMVRDGHVWVYRRTVHDRSLIELEEAARSARRGLWSLPESDRIPPWQYRYQQRKNSRKSAVAARLIILWSKEAEALSHDIDVGPAKGVTFAGLERAEAGGFHQTIAPVTAGIVIAPGAERGGEGGARWAVVIPQAVEVADHFQAER
jgi:endonuclease YncB( thermonuclease family)